MPSGRAGNLCLGGRGIGVLAGSFRTKTGALAVILAAISAPLLAGCHAPPTACGPTEMVLRLPDRDCFMDNVLTVLRRYDLPPERRGPGGRADHLAADDEWAVV